MKDKISVIIPVYNVEAYIHKCLTSVANQTHTNLEIICIDDGSTDTSGIICEEFAKTDKRFIVVHKQNEGVAVAKNIALEIATGDYIGFVDSDDWIEPDMYEKLLKSMQEYSVEIGCGNYNKVFGNRVVCMENMWLIKKGRLAPEDILYYAFNRDHYMGFGAYLCTKLFKAEVAKKYRFQKDIRYAEDVLYLTELVTKSKVHAVYTEEPFYNYFQREDSASNKEDLAVRIDSIRAYAKVLECTAGEKSYEEAERWIKRFYCYHASLLAEIAYAQGNKEKLIEFQQEMKKYLPEYIETNKEYSERIAGIYKILEYKL